MKREDVHPVSPVGFPPNVSTVSHQAAKMKMTMRNEDGKTAAGMVMMVMMVKGICTFSTARRKKIGIFLGILPK